MDVPRDPVAMGSTESLELQHARGHIPERIGRYHIKRVIASGGMGTVYEATQESPRRVVAVKVMKQGIASRSALRRFEYEGQILGRLRHPGIAQIFEAGVHAPELRASARADAGMAMDDAVPYFAMEYIPNAKPLIAYAQEKKLSIRERMKLFVQVCDAVHHGHQKGIIHRDLKPSNILVDSTGQVKIIDFGVARSTDSDLAVTTLQTDVGQLIGTLQYMSPEQCEADPHDIDIRSDVYSLGVVFYQLVCGLLPYDLTRVPMHHATRIIREQDPTKLSTINRTLRGDVETIALKALEKERERRYQSAADLAHDIQRYLDGEAILARRASIVYQLRLFARRNKAAFTAIATTFVILLAGVIVSTSLYFRAEAARAEQSRERQRAEAERAKAEKFAEFMEQTLKGVGPSVALGRDNTMLKEVMDGAAKRITDGELSSAPDAELRLRMTIGNVYNEIAAFAAAETMFAPTVELAERGLAKSRDSYDGDHPDVARALANLGDALYSVGRQAQALAKFEESLAMRRRLFPGDHADVAQSLSDVGGCLRSLNRQPVALPYLEEALRMRQALSPGDHFDKVQSLQSLAFCYDWLGRLADALPKFEEALEMGRRLQPGDHPDTALSLNMVAYSLQSLRRDAEALVRYQEALEMQRRLTPGDHLMIATLTHTVAFTLDLLGRSQEALPLFDEALAMDHRLYPGESYKAALVQGNRAHCLSSLARHEESLQAFEETLAVYRRVLPQNDWRIRFHEIYLARGLGGMGRHAEAEGTMLPAWAEIKSRPNVPMIYKRRCLETLAAVYESWDAAEPGKGYDEKAAEWRAKLEELNAETQERKNAETRQREKTEPPTP